jgi:ABC-type nitrate/sulfonate/bicarbonate transport system ATPase subunit
MAEDINEKVNSENSSAIDKASEKVILQAKNVTHRYDRENIIEDIQLSLAKGEIISLLGVSGVGKTTLFNTLSGVVTPTAGNVLLEGEDITGKSGLVSYMLQKDMLLPYFTVEDNIAIPLLIKGINKKEARKEVGKHLEEFGLSGTEKDYPSQLSGGMRQRAALLRTYLFSSKVALLDEPFSALDAITKAEMHKWYLEVMEQIKMSTIFITHDIDEAILLSDKIYIMAGKPGKLTAEIVIDEPRPRRADYNVSVEFLNYKKQILGLLK